MNDIERATVSIVSTQIISAFKSGNKVLICGNGGSAAESQHFAAELMGRFEKERKGLPAIALTTDTSAITAIGNDFGFKYIFSRQIEALAKEGDVLITLSTSGESENIKEAEKTGVEYGMILTPFPTRKHLAGWTTTQIQELHLKLIHLISRQVENAFLPE